MSVNAGGWCGPWWFPACGGLQLSSVKQAAPAGLRAHPAGLSCASGMQGVRLEVASGSAKSPNLVCLQVLVIKGGAHPRWPLPKDARLPFGCY